VGRSADGGRSRKRAGRRVREQLRAEGRQLVRENLGRIAIFAACWSGLAILTTWAILALGGSAAVAGANAGFYMGLAPFWVLMLRVTTGLAHRGMGAEAEVWTADELKHLDDQRWTVFHDVPIGAGNVDHVAVGPGRIYAIETKWTARTDTERFLKGAAGQTARGARALRVALASRGVVREVVPLLVVWGPRHLSRVGEQPRMIGPVRVVAGGASAHWLARMKGALDRLENDWPATRTIEEIIDEEELALGG
jgi:hypothetical protein